MFRLPISQSELFNLPDEPLMDGWGEKWDDDALAVRLERFGLKLKKSAKGYTVVKASTGNPVAFPTLGYEAVDRPHHDICNLLEDFELAEAVKRQLMDE
jgi:hypothetical protein